MKKKLSEQFVTQPQVHPVNQDIYTDNMLAAWGEIPFAGLSLLLVQVRYLALLHQTNHWISKSDSYYGDHLLFDRLYEAVSGEVDMIAEKAVGLGCINNVDICLQATQLQKLVAGGEQISTIPSQDQLVKRSLAAEVNFLKCIDRVIEHINSTGLMTRGLDNLLAGIYDTHEGHIYLLKQRCTC
jgi:DNA-binding ferritin-like protein